MFAHRSDPARQRGLSYTEILIATVLIAIALVPALEAMKTIYSKADLNAHPISPRGNLPES